MSEPVGYSLSCYDNKSWYWEGFVDAPRCEGCGLVTDPSWINPDFRLERRDLDYSATWDGNTVVSARFVEAASGHDGARFIEIPSEPGYFLIDVDRAVEFDPVARGTRLLDPCPTCDRYTQAAGATPVYLRPGVQLPPGFSRTDIEFGSAHPHRPDRAYQQHPIILVGPALGATLAAAKLRGPILKPIANNT